MAGRERRWSTRRRRPLVSACLIVRDEEPVLARCLRSIAAAVDEICVVDTGSTDRSPEIARRFGAKVVEFTVCNGTDGRIVDFAAARNAALDVASGDWILKIDADEVLRLPSKDRLRTLARTTSLDAVGGTIVSGPVKWAIMPLFRRTRTARFVGRIHEYVPMERDRIRRDASIELRHLPDKRGKEGSAERNLRLCLLELDDNSGSGRTLYYLANALQCLGRYEEAIVRYEEALTSANYEIGRFAANYYQAVCYMRIHQWKKAAEKGLAALSADPRFAEAHCLLGDAWLAMERPTFAAQWFRSALTCGEPPLEAVFFSFPRMYSSYPRRRLRDLRLGMRSALPARGRRGTRPRRHAPS